MRGRPRTQRPEAAIRPVTCSRPISPEVIIEAQAAGLPVVAYAASGIPEIVEDGKTGIMIEPDHAAQYGAALEKILSDDALRKKMSAQSTAAMQRFEVATVVKRLVAFYEQLASKN